MRARLTIAMLVELVAAHSVAGQTNPAALYEKNCAACHDSVDVRAPDRATLKSKTPEAILTSLTSGTMAVQAGGLNATEKRAIAEFLGTRAAADASSPQPALCAASHFPDRDAGPRWSGWGADVENTRFQERAGLDAADVPKLKLKWAFGFPGATIANAQPAVAGGRVFVGSAAGVVYSLDVKTGCAHWSQAVPAGVRTAMSIGSISTGTSSRHAVFFGDLAATVHALDASTGAPIWSTRLDSHKGARITGAPTLHDNRLYVPVSSIEEMFGAKEGYECCTFRGSVSALDAATGALLWKTYTIAESPRPTRKTPAGTQLWGPSGASSWTAPTIDVARRTLYVGTGNSYSEPAADTSDAIVAIDMESGKIKWTQQLTPKDVFIVNCREGNPNCVQPLGPDFDLGSSPILRSVNGRSLLFAGQKSGVAYALDPDKKGLVVWQFRAGKGGMLGGIEWGMAADGENVYIPVSDVLEPADAPRGLFAVRMATGEKVWQAPAAALSAAITVIPGIVFAGSVDGHLRAYSTRDGSVVWDFDTVREFDTINHVTAKGGSIDAAGPVVVDGIVLTNSGYGMWRGQPGNVLLAFEAEK